MRQPARQPIVTPTIFQILLVLTDGERHGYAIMRDITRNTDGQMRVGPGTLYRSIKQMLQDGWIEESDDRPDPELDDERRRYYRLTAAGRRIAKDEASRLERLARLAVAKRLLEETPL